MKSLSGWKADIDGRAYLSTETGRIHDVEEGEAGMYFVETDDPHYPPW